MALFISIHFTKIFGAKGVTHFNVGTVHKIERLSLRPLAQFSKFAAERVLKVAFRIGGRYFEQNFERRLIAGNVGEHRDSHLSDEKLKVT